MEQAKTTMQITCSITGRLAHRIIYSLQPLRSSIFITHNGRNINAKSLLGILSLQLKAKDIINILCYQDNENQAKADCVRAEEIFNTINQENN